jgi:RHS repeat-associated protein
MFMKALMGLLLGCLLSPAGATETVIYYHNDALGSPIAATNAEGQVVWREQYEPYGERLVNEPKSRNSLWYTGKPEEEALGLSYFGARWYNPRLGRFMGMDPVEAQAGDLYSFNRYAYANNNPYKFVDPDGQAAESVTDFISLGISVGMFAQDPSLANALGVLGDAIGTAVPFLPAGAGIIRSGLKAADEVGDVTKNVANPVPETLARVIPGKGPSPTLGPPGKSDVFVTAADDIAGLHAKQIAERLTIDPADSFTVIKFPTPQSGLASPVNRLDPGFIGRKNSRWRS